METLEPKLNSIYRDKISGYEGVCTAISDWVFACKRVGLRKIGVDEKTGEPYDECNFDVFQVELVEEYPYTHPFVENIEVALGDLVKERVTGFSGIIVCMTSYLDMNTRVNVQPRGLNPKTKLPVDVHAFNVASCELIEKGAVPGPNQEEEKPAEEKKTKVKTGGPDRDGFSLPSNPTQR